MGILVLGSVAFVTFSKRSQKEAHPAQAEQGKLIEAEGWKQKLLREYLVNRVGEPQIRLGEICLNVGAYTKNNSRCYICFNLDHLGKEGVNKLIREGKLYNEILFLYDLAHLPYAEAYPIGVYIDEHTIFEIIDRVHLSIEGTYEDPYLGGDPQIEQGIAWLQQKVNRKFQIPCQRRTRKRGERKGRGLP